MSLLDTASLIVTPNGYKEGTLYSVIPSDGSGDMSVVRATTATRVNSAGLVELVPYNLLTYSEQFNNADWIKYSTTITSNSTTAPNGQTTADTVTDTASGGLVLQTSQVNVNAGTTVTFSQYVKRSNNDWVYLGIARGGATTYGEVVGFFNLATGATGSNVIYSAGVFVGLSIENVGNGWYRCSLTAYVPSAVFYVGYSGNANTNGVPFVSSIGDEFYAWGAQLVEGTLPKDYQKTETRLNIPRLDYSNGTCPNLLVEPQRTNILKYSSEFISPTWITGGVLPNTTISPDGTQNADTCDTTLQLFQAIPASTSTVYTVSLWVKLGTATNLCLVVNNQLAWNTIGGQSFDSSNGLNTTTWTRISYTFTTPASLPLGAINFHIGQNGESGLVQSSGNVYIWGSQLEAGTYPTSYIPTTSASVTRNADVISKTGISSLIGQTEGTIFLDFDYNDLSTNFVILNAFLASNANNRIFFHILSNKRLEIICDDNGNTQFDVTTSSALTLGKHRIAFAYKLNDFAFYLDGTLIGSDTSGSVPTLDSIILDDYYQSLNNFKQATNINASALWKTRLTNTQLAQLTTI